MKDIYEILNILKADIEADLPAILTANGLSDLEEYQIGGSRKANCTGIFIYPDVFTYAYDAEVCNVIFQLQLYKIDLVVAAQYADIIRDYIRDYKPVNIGCVLLQGIDVDTWPIEQTSTTLIYITASWRDELDSCDN